MNSNINIDKEIFKKHKVKLAYLFGSQAKGNAVPQSDFDVAVLFEDKPSDPLALEETTFLSLELNKFFPAEVDVVCLNSAPSLLKFEVIYHGKLLYVDDERGRLDFEVSSIKEHIDTKHIRDIYFAALEKRIKEEVS